MYPSQNEIEKSDVKVEDGRAGRAVLLTPLPLGVVGTGGRRWGIFFYCILGSYMRAEGSSGSKGKEGDAFSILLFLFIR